MDYVIARGKPSFGCSTDPLTMQAAQGRMGELEASVVARDKSLLDRWAIIRLEEDFPPFLDPLPGTDGERVGIVLETGRGSCSAGVRYRFSQQQSKPEAGTSVALHLVHPDGARVSLYEGPPGPVIRLPAGARGNLVAAVTPRTQTRAGRMFESVPVSLKACGERR